MGSLGMSRFLKCSGIADDSFFECSPPDLLASLEEQKKRNERHKLFLKPSRTIESRHIRPTERKEIQDAIKNYCELCEME